MASSKYSLYKWTIFATMYTGYVLFIYNRKAFTFAMPTIMKEENLEKDDLGLIASSQTLAYTISKFLAGLIADHASPKLLFASGLGLLGIFTVLFTFFSSKWMFATIWFLLGISAGSGWPACAKILRQWFSPVEFGTWWSILSTSMNVAGSVGPPLATFVIMQYNWRASFIIPGVLAMVVAGISLLSLKNSPEDVGMPSAQPESKSKDKEKTSRGGWKDIVKSPFLWMISVSYMVVFLVRTAALDWAQLYLIQDRKQSQYIGSIFISSLEIGGIIGSVVAGYLADRMVAWSKKNPGAIQGSPRLVVVIALVSGIVLFLHLLLFTVGENSSSVWINMIGFSLGFCIYGPVAVYGVMAIESAPSHLAATCHAVVALAANVGAVFAGLPLSIIAQAYDWMGAFLLLEVLTLFILGLKVYLRTTDHKVAGAKKKRE